jgi:PadR family transcriptional regulator, regulatory protein PadR
MIIKYQKEIQTKLAKGLLNVIVLQLLEQQPMHGYQIKTKIRQKFGINFGASTIYPLLGTLETKGQVKSEWNMSAEKPRKIFRVTEKGQEALRFTENTLNLICKNLSRDYKIAIEAAPDGEACLGTDAATFQ